MMGATFLAIGYVASHGIARFSSLHFYKASPRNESGIATSLKGQLRKHWLEVLLVVLVILLSSGIILVLFLPGSHSQNFPPFATISTIAPNFLGSG